MANVIVRKARILEFSKVLRIQRTHSFHNSFYLWLLRGYVEGNVFVAESNKVIVGFIIWNNKTLRSIVVNEKYRGSGVGKTLIEKTLPKTDIQIAECSPHNEGFYSKLGFKTEKLRVVKHKNQ